VSTFRPSNPEKEEITLRVAGFEIKAFSEYTYASQVDIPADGWSFTIGTDKLPDNAPSWLLPGQYVELKLNGTTQGAGYIDSVTTHASRGGGTEYTIEGRDLLAQAVDACADPTHVFKEGSTLLDVMLELFGPFGWDSEDDFITDNDENTLAKAGIRGTPLTRGGKKKGPKPLKSFVIHQLKPYPREGVFAFASRIAQRHGKMIWQIASGEKLVVSNPNFDIEPFYKLIRNATGTTNVLEGSVKLDIKNQPTCIVADGWSSQGEFGGGRLKSITANTAVATSDPAFLTPFRKYPDAKRVLGHAFATPIAVPRARTLYLHDPESQTQEQLDNFVRREMAHLQRESVVCSYTVEGHGQITQQGFIPWTVDTTVDVADDVANFRERMYVLGRTFHKSRTGGTTTSLTLIRLNTIVLGEPASAKPAPKVTTDGEIIRLRDELDLDN
jgi:prophage tail gpP-like protein